MANIICLVVLLLLVSVPSTTARKSNFWWCPDGYHLRNCGKVPMCYLFMWGVGVSLNHYMAVERCYSDLQEGGLLFYEDQEGEWGCPSTLAGSDQAGDESSRRNARLINQVLWYLTNVVQPSFRSYDWTSGIYGVHYEYGLDIRNEQSKYCKEGADCQNIRPAPLPLLYGPVDLNSQTIYSARKLKKLDLKENQGKWRKDLYQQPGNAKITPDIWFPIDPLLIFTSFTYNQNEPRLATSERPCGRNSVSQVITTSDSLFPKIHIPPLTSSNKFAYYYLDTFDNKAKKCFTWTRKGFSHAAEPYVSESLRDWWYFDPYSKNMDSWLGYGLNFPTAAGAIYNATLKNAWNTNGAIKTRNHRELSQLRGVGHGLILGVEDDFSFNTSVQYTAMQLFGSFFEAPISDVGTESPVLPSRHCHKGKTLSQIRTWDDCWFNDWALSLKYPRRAMNSTNYSRGASTPKISRNAADAFVKSSLFPWAAIGCKRKALKSGFEPGADFEIVDMHWTDISQQCPDKFQWQTQTGSCFFVDAAGRYNETDPTGTGPDFDVWRNNAYDYCANQVLPGSTWPQPRDEKSLAHIHGLMVKSGIIGVALGIRCKAGQWQFVNSYGTVESDSVLWEDKAHASNCLADTTVTAETCGCTGLIRKSFTIPISYKPRPPSDRPANHLEVEHSSPTLLEEKGGDPDYNAFRHSKIVIPGPLYKEAKSCTAGISGATENRRNFFTKWGGVVCEYRLDDCRHYPTPDAWCKTVTVSNQATCNTAEGTCDCDEAMGWYPQRIRDNPRDPYPYKALNLFQCVQFPNLLCNNKYPCPVVPGTQLTCTEATQCACPETHLLNSAKTGCDLIPSTTAIAIIACNPGINCQCNASVASFLQDALCKNAFSHRCSQSEPCPVLINGMSLRCDALDHKCHCPIGLSPNQPLNPTSCVGPNLQSGLHQTAFDKFHKQLEPCKDSSGCRMSCYPEVDPLRCVCAADPAHPGMKGCNCPPFTPRKIRCNDLGCDSPVCDVGFVYNRPQGGCIDFDECKYPQFNDCDLTLGTCVNRNGTYECHCPLGYHDTRQSLEANIICTDINECTDTGGHICGDPVNTCSNTPGSYLCICAGGYFFINGTCIAMKECEAYEQICENKAAYCLMYPNSPQYECKCRRTFYYNAGGFCLVGSHVYEFVLRVKQPFIKAYNDESSDPFQRLSQVTEKWATNVVKTSPSYPMAFQRAVATRFEPDLETDGTKVFVTLIFDVKITGTSSSELMALQGNNRLLFLTEKIKGLCPVAPVASQLGNVVKLDELHSEKLEILCAETQSQFNISELNPCLRPKDHDCETAPATFCRHPRDDKYAFNCSCIQPGYKTAAVYNHRSTCTDINECKQTKCQPVRFASCKNTPGSFVCSCKPGYVLDTKRTTCIPQDFCKDHPFICGSPDINGVCVPGLYPNYTCLCKEGYAYNKTKSENACDDINECADGLTRKQCLDMFAVCLNVPGSSKCECPGGFYFDKEEALCRISALSFQITLQFANQFVATLADPISAAYDKVFHDTANVLKRVFKPSKFTSKNFASSQLMNISAFGESFINTTIILNFGNTGENITSESVTNLIIDQLPGFCASMIDLSGTCILERTAYPLRLPIITVTHGDTEGNKTTRNLPPMYKIPIEQLIYGCDLGQINDCNYMQQCTPLVVGPTQPYPFKCTCTAPYKFIKSVDNDDVCLDACSLEPCMNVGTCNLTDDSVGYRCSCVGDHFGQNCTDIVCDSAFCNWYGVCTLTDGVKKCACEKYFSGSNCERNIPMVVSTCLGAFFGVWFLIWLLAWLCKPFCAERKNRDWWIALKPKIKTV